ncbi:MAG: hypothetical protein L0Z51_06435, partial [Candidatus Latescibacteria bacterium]|nr:hypothetical protein [Candidatus Latescibacterota bacterium]
MNRLHLHASMILLYLLGHPIAVHAQWQLDGAQVTSEWSHEIDYDVVSDGAGGIILAWRDGRSGNYRIYVQRVNALGENVWTPNGVALTTVSEQGPPTLVSDGVGGAIVTWHDLRNGNEDVYAQRVNGAGVPQWTAGGVAVCTNSQSQTNPRIVSDFAGGAIIAWTDQRFLTTDFYAQRVNGAGAVQWTADGEPMFVDFYAQDYLVMVADGAGGATLAWMDYAFADTRIMAQQVNQLGNIYHPSGLEVCTSPGYKFDLVIAPDGSYGAYVAWGDTRSLTDSHLYAQRVTGSGFLWWIQDGIAISTVSSTADVAIAFDAVGGAIISWSDFRNGSDYDIYAQRVNEQGILYWPANGVPVCTAPFNQQGSDVIPDGAGGAIIAWMDTRNGGNVHGDIYADRLNSSGAATWAFNGLSLCAAIAHQRKPLVTSDALGGGIVAWEDFRSGNSDLHAQRVEKRGYWGRPEPLAESAADVPGDQGGKIAVNWIASGQDAHDLQVVTHYSVWRATDVEPASSALAVSAEEIGPDFDGAAYRREVDAAGDEYYWEWVGNQAAIYSPRYSFSAATRSDSTSQGSADHYFQVLAHTWNNFVHWTSNVVSGRSIDNLAPAAPLLLTAQRVGSEVHLRWNGVRVSDLRDYAVYRATATGVTPVPGSFFSSSADTVLVDGSAPATALYYIVTAYDVHENQSVPSNE